MHGPHCNRKMQLFVFFRIWIFVFHCGCKTPQFCSPTTQQFALQGVGNQSGRVLYGVSRKLNWQSTQLDVGTQYVSVLYSVSRKLSWQSTLQGIGNRASRVLYQGSIIHRIEYSTRFRVHAQDHMKNGQNQLFYETCGKFDKFF